MPGVRNEVPVVYSKPVILCIIGTLRGVGEGGQGALMPRIRKEI